jgi:carboxyl-terminal processing protease
LSRGICQEADFDPARTLDEVCRLVQEHFFDSRVAGPAWLEQQERHRVAASRAETRDQFAEVVNEMLRSLNASHTAYFSQDDPRRYQILGIFEAVADQSRSDLFTYDGIGIATAVVGDRRFVTAVFDGLPGAAAGLQYGDELVAVDGRPFHPIASFRGNAGRRVRLAVRRTGPDAETLEIPVDVTRINARTMFETAMNSSVRVIAAGNQYVGYVHLWSYAGWKYHERLTDLLLGGELADCDSLVLDLRDGWGGANVEYVNLFRPPLVEIQSRSRGQPPRTFTGAWQKPVVLLTNAGTTSGKELFAFAFKKFQLGEVIGGRTAGAVVAGRCFLLTGGDVLYLAVADLRVDGQRLEGVGVEPTIRVERPLEYAQGRDPQLDRALEFLTTQ